MKCPIVLACDERFAMPLATAMRSVVDSNHDNWPLEFHILSDGFSESARRNVFASLPKGSASVRWVPVDLRPFREFATLSHISKMTYARFLVPHILEDTVSKILYLDADILVLDDLRPLWETDLEGALMGAVLDRVDPKLKRNESGFDDVPRVRDYFNAGVLLIDLDLWRKDRISEKALEYLRQYPRSPYSDQDALNVVCDGLWKKLDSRWNSQDYYEKKKISDMDPKERPGIVHFVFKMKPWNPSIPNANASFYDSFRSRTCFARTFEDRLWDTFQAVWSRLKGALRQYAFLRAIWSQIGPSKKSEEIH